MNKILMGFLLAFFVCPAQAGSLILSCAGVVTGTHVPKVGIAADPEKETIVDFSVVVNLDAKTVSAELWWDRDYEHALPLPIYSIEVNIVRFRDSSTNKSIQGTVDRITGKFDADKTINYNGGSFDMQNWDLRCRPVKPLF